MLWGAILVASLAMSQGAQHASGKNAAEQFLLLTTQYDAGSTLSGSTIGATWMRRDSAGTVLLAGAESSKFGSASWQQLRLGGARRFGQRAIVSSEVLTGKGKRDGGSFNLFSARADLSTTLVAGKLFFSSNLRHIDIDTSHGQLAGLGLQAVSDSLGMLKLEYTDTIGGNLGTELVQIDWQRDFGRWRVALGVAEGSSQPQLFDVFDGSVESRNADLRNYLAKLRLPFADRAVEVILRRLELGGEYRSTVAVLWRLPLKSAAARKSLR